MSMRSPSFRRGCNFGCSPTLANLQALLWVVLYLATAAAAPNPTLAAPSIEPGAAGMTSRVEGRPTLHQIGFDARGRPLVCGLTREDSAGPGSVGLGVLPLDTRGWETIPGVIRADGSQAFRLEVDTNGPVESVELWNIPPYFVGTPGPTAQLHDDGLGEDRVPGDFIYTVGPFSTDPSYTLPEFYMNDPDSPSGLHSVELGLLIVTEVGGETWQSMVSPEIGLIRGDIPDAAVLPIASDVAATSRVVNIRTNLHATQKYIRLLEYDVRQLTARFYQVFPDLTDFIFLLSTNKIEDMQGASGRNLVAGTHIFTKIDFTGTGLTPMDDTNAWGSNGVLQGINILDAYSRGISSRVITHELAHQWVAFTDPALGLGDDGAHYSNWSSAASLVGGFEWVGDHGNSYTINCEEGRNGAHHSPPLDLYMIGLLDGSDVPDLRVSQSTLFPGCGATVSDYFKVTVGEIQRRHGARTPGLDGSQRMFRLAFLVESHERLLNPTEMAYYELLAAHATKTLPLEVPDPYVGDRSWVPFTRYFGDDVVWEPYPTGVAVQPLVSPETSSTSQLAIRLKSNPGSRSRGVELIVVGLSQEGRPPALEMFDTRGRRVDTVPGRRLDGERYSFVWDGRDRTGRTVASGVYFARARQGHLAVSRKVVLVD